MATRIDDLMSQYLSKPNVSVMKENEVAATAASKRAQLTSIPSPDSLYPTSVAAREGINSPVTSQLDEDLRTSSAWDLFKKYGTQAGSLMGSSSIADNRYTQQATAYRDGADQINDSVDSAARGLVGTFGGIGAFGLGLANKHAGVWASEGLKAIDDHLASWQSDGLHAKQAANAVKSSLQEADHALTEKEEASGYGTFMAKMRRIGRDVWSSGTNALSDSDLTGDTIANGIGSLFVGGPVARGIGAVGRLGLKAGMGVGAVGFGGARTALRIGEKLKMPAAIGLMEGGAAYQQTTAEAYDLLKDRTDLSDSQKNELANQAGLIAAAIQAPVGAITGKLVEKFEAHPLKSVGSIRQIGATLLKEGLEEGTQGGTGQLAQNLGIQMKADQTRDLASGVGEQISLGAIGGLGSAGVVQGPHAVLHAGALAGRSALSGIASLGSSIGDAINGRADNVRAGLEAQSPISVDNINTMAADTARDVSDPTIRSDLFQHAQNVVENPKQKQQVTDYLTKVFDHVGIDPVAEANAQFSPAVADVVRQSTDKFDAMHRVSQLAIDPKTSPADKLAAGLYLLNANLKNEELVGHDLPNAIAQVDDNHPQLGRLRKFEDTMVLMQSHPEIQKAIQAGLKFANEADAKSVTNVSTPEGIQAAHSVMGLALHDPAHVDPGAVKTVLGHITSGDLNASPEERRAIENANALHQSKALDLTDSQSPFAQVSKEIRSSHQQDISAADFVSRITAARNAGMNATAAALLHEFMKFAQHMNNKVDAVNRHLYDGDGTKKTSMPFQALNPKTRRWYSDKLGVGVTLGSEKSVQFAQGLQGDAHAVSQLANHLAQTMPELGVKPIEPVLLDHRLTQKPADVVKQFMSGKLLPGQGNPNTQSKTQEEAKPQREKPAASSEEPAQQELPLDAPKSKEDQASRTKTGPEEQSNEAVVQTEAPAGTRPGRQEAQGSVTTNASDATVSTAEKTPVETVDKSVEEKAAAPAETVPEAPKNGLEATYPNLVENTAKGVINWFRKSFKLPGGEQPISRLMSMDNIEPIPAIQKALTSTLNFEKFTGSAEALNGRITPELAQAYAELFSYVEPIYKTAKAELAKFIQKDIYKGQTFADALLNGVQGDKNTPANTFIRTKVLNLVETTKDGSLGYNEEILQSSILAGLQWVLKSQMLGANYDAEKVGQILGIDESEVKPEWINAFNQGFSEQEASRDLGQLINRFWGVTPDRNAPQGYTIGIPEAMAKEIFLAMEKAGLVHRYTAEINGKSFNRIELSDTKSVRELVQSLAAKPDAIERAALTQPEDQFIHIGEPPKHVAKNQLRNRIVENTRQGQQAIEEAQSIPQHINLKMFDLMSHLGVDTLADWFGEAQLLSNSNMNVNHRKSVDGRVRNIVAAFQAAQQLVAQVTNVAKAQGVEPHEVPVYHEYNMTKVNRLQQLGKHTPQANKLTRELLLPTWNTVNLADRTGQDHQMFMLAAAQHLGIKVHKQAISKSIEQVQKLLVGPLAPLVERLQAWDAKHATGADTIFKADEIGQMKAILGDKMSPAAVHAVLEYARLQNADAKERANFRTAMYVEADGVTDGPINAMIHMASGPFTSHWVRMVAKGGLFINQSGMTMNDYIESDKADGSNQDLYQEATNWLVKLFDGQRRRWVANPAASQQLTHLTTVLTNLLPDMVQTKDGELLIDRGMVKNPMTVSLYGAGEKGIASKVTRAITDALYEQLSHGGTTSEVRTALRILTNSALLNTSEGLVVKKFTKMDVNSTKGVDFTLTPQELANLRTNVQNMFVSPMRESINQVAGETHQAMEAVRAAVQIQSLVLQQEFKTAVDTKMADKAKNDPTWRSTDFLSQTELDEIFQSLKPLSPFVSTGTQNFFMAGSENSNVETSQFSRSLGDKMKTDAYIYGPNEAGVKGKPFLTIGAGDGQMIQSFMTMPGRPNVLPVFDGVNFSLKDIQRGSQMLNQAVFQGWQGNPVQATAKSFNTFLEHVLAPGNLNTTPELLTKIAEAISGRGQAGDMTVDQAKSMMKALGEQITSLGQEIEARHNVLSKVPLSVDHMATAASPFENAKSSIELKGENPDQVAIELQDHLTKELEKLRGEPADMAENVDAAIQKLGELTNSGAVRTNGEALRRVIPSLKMPKELKTLVAEAVRSLRGKDLRIIMGNASQITAEANRLGVPLPATQGNGRLNGFASVDKNAMFLINPNPEVIAHELIHMATLNKVSDYYNNPSKLSKIDREAVARIDALLDDWTQADLPDDASQQTAITRNGVITQIQQYWVSGQKANALNEFMAWVLTNQDLADAASKQQSRFTQLIGKALDAIRSLIWGPNRGPKIGSDILSNLRFNTELLMASDYPTVIGEHQTLASFTADGFGTDERLAQIRQSLGMKLAGLVHDQPRPDLKTVQSAKIGEALAQATAVTESFLNAGFAMTPQAANTFAMLTQVMATQAYLDANSMARAQELYTHVMQNITVEDFMPDNGNDQDRYYAQLKYDALMGRFGTETDAQKRSSLLPAFLALANVDNDFRRVLERMELPKSEKARDRKLDTILEHTASTLSDQMALMLSGEGRSQPNVQAAIDALTNRIAESNSDQRTQIELNIGKAGTYIDKLNDTVADWIKDGSSFVADLVDKVQNKTDSKIANNLLTGVKHLALLANEDRHADVTEGWVKALNSEEANHSMRELVAEVAGRTKSNAPIFDLIKPVRTFVSKIRQHFREDVPKVINKQFTRELESYESTALHDVLAKTDVAGLIENGLSLQQVMDMVQDPTTAVQHVQAHEEEISKLAPQQASLLQQKAKELANYMNTGEITSANLLRNATAIANLFGENGRASITVTPALIKSVSNLVALYAFQGSDKASKETLAGLTKEETTGVKYALSYLRGVRMAEMDRVSKSPLAEVNHYQGYAPAENAHANSLIVSDDHEYSKMRELGFQRVADYQGSRAERGIGPRGYYMSPLNKPMFQQGIMQNVRQTAGGVDPATGFSLGRDTAGQITDPVQVQQIERNIRVNQGAKEPLIPVYNEKGSVVAYERSLHPEQLNKVEKVTDLAKVLGIWKGRQIEEQNVGQFNRGLIDALGEMWKREKVLSKDEYINLLDPRLNDKVMKDAVRLMVPEMRADVANAFGARDEFWVRRDMVNNVVGYRSPSVGDAWTGNTRWSPEVQKGIKQFATAAFGADAYKHLMRVEQGIHLAVVDARMTIVIKSVFVPISNMISNFYHMMSVGVPFSSMVRGFPKKLSEAQSYVKTLHRMTEAGADLQVALAENDLKSQQRLKAEIQSIQDSHRRLTIWPLIEKGEMNSISDASITREEIMLAEGRLQSYMEKLTDKLPETVKTAGKYAIVSRDTALFRGLQTATEFGDFLAKAILYDDLMKRKGLTSEEALIRITEEFVHYDFLPGRTRTGLDRAGLTWFWHFKLRSIKTAFAQVRQNPLNTFLSYLVPRPKIFGSIGTPFNDNMLSVIADGRLRYSVGPGQGFHAYSLNPWWNLFN